MKSFRHLFLAVAKRIGIARLIPDKMYLKLLYRDIIGKKLNLKNPVTYGEKLQWLKLYDRNPLYHMLVDKYEVKNYIKEKIGSQYVVPLYGVWNTPGDIDFSSLPDSFVLKSTHDSGGYFICKNKEELDEMLVREKYKKLLSRDYYLPGREWVYKGVKPRVIAEKYLGNEDEKSIDDYKVMCFEGIPKLIEVHQGRFENHTQDFYDAQWNKTEISQGTKTNLEVLERPAFLDEMLEKSSYLAKGIHHVRVDWYYSQGQLYFGELTFFDDSGFSLFEPEQYNKIIGDWIEIDRK
ncbi:MAG: glycosyl transferase [Lachnospiraceae bacterium]|nr:glycosyl transferase [Lachnospiraceae bacterium]